MTREPSCPSSPASAATSAGANAQFPPLSRHHSRSSSQLATMASLSLSFSPTSPTMSPRVGQSSSTNVSPRSSQFGAINAMTPWDSNAASHRDVPASHEATSTAPTRKASKSDRRKTLPSIGSPSPLSHLASASAATTPSPLPSPDPQHPGPFSPDSRTALASLPPTDPTTPAQTSFPNSSIGLAQLIQQKRRQASAPYFHTARTYQQQRANEPAAAGFTVLSGGGVTGGGGGSSTTTWNGGWAAPCPGPSSAISDSPLSTIGGVASPILGGAASLDASGGGGGPPAAASLPPSRSRSRHGSRRSTTSGRLSLQTSGLHLSLNDPHLSMSPPGVAAGDEGMVMTPTTEEWRSLGGKLSELADLRAKDEARLRLNQDERNDHSTSRREPDQNKLDCHDSSSSSTTTRGGDAGGEQQHKPTATQRKRNPLRPSLWDVSSDEEDDEDDDDDSSSDDLGLSLSLSRFTSSGKRKGDKRTPMSSSPSSVSIPTPPPPASTASSDLPRRSLDSSDSTITRPTYSHVPKSSFSYSSTVGGKAGGFVSHSNTSSLSSVSTPLSAPPTATEFRETANDTSATTTTLTATGSDVATKAPGSEPLPAVETFKPLHRPQKSESSVQLQPTTIARPALSRGSLTSATGGLSSAASSSTSSASSSPIVINSERDQGSRSPPKGLGLPKIPLPPNVYRSLEEGLLTTSAAVTGSGGAAGHLDEGGGGGGGIGTPRSTAPTPVPLERGDSVPTPYEPPFAPPSPARDDATGAVVQAVDLDWTKPPGPVDPRTYSAVTGLRDISSFVVEREEAGKGAYGSVRRAREKGPGGNPVGPELIIKYVIKQRILADCWKKHKILGPIPIEVHVLDHLRRVPFVPRPRLRFLDSMKARRDANGGGGGGDGGRKRTHGPGAGGGLLTRRDSARPEIDLWHGGDGGGTVATGHPNVCGLLDFFEDGEFYYLVMPQATASARPPSSPGPGDDGLQRQGQDLFDFVDLNPTGLPPRSISRILAQVADALSFLHEHSIVHRDIKDENVVLDADGNVRLIDFGSAAYVKDGRFFDTFSGTLDFAAPEVLKGARYSGREQDVWALGVLGYVLICGECPFWSPEEAMRGLAPDSRAFAQLQLKLPDAELNVGAPPPAAATGTTREEEAEDDDDDDDDDDEEPSMADAIDLVTRCLEIDLSLRPSADAVCDHTFIAGAGGWRGTRGWDPVESGDEEDAGV